MEAATQYPPEAATPPIDVTIGIFFSFTRNNASLINSDAKTDPPGVLTLTTTAFI